MLFAKSDRNVRKQMNTSNLPNPVVDQIVSQMKTGSILLSEKPKQVEFEHTRFYLVDIKNSPPMVLREDGSIVDSKEAEKVYQQFVIQQGVQTAHKKKQGMFFVHVLLIFVSFIFSIILILLLNNLLQDFTTPMLTGNVIYDDYYFGYVFFCSSLFLTYFIWQGLLFLFFSKYRQLFTSRKIKWRLIIPLFFLILYLPLLALADDSYLVVTSTGIYQSDFWRLGDDHHFDWKDIKSAKLSLEKIPDIDSYNVDLYIKTKNNSIYDLYPDGEETEFVSVVNRLVNKNILVNTPNVSPNTISSLRVDYGQEVSTLFIKNKIAKTKPTTLP